MAIVIGRICHAHVRIMSVLLLLLLNVGQILEYVVDCVATKYCRRLIYRHTTNLPVRQFRQVRWIFLFFLNVRKNGPVCCFFFLFALTIKQ